MLSLTIFWIMSEEVAQPRRTRRMDRGRIESLAARHRTSNATARPRASRFVESGVALRLLLHELVVGVYHLALGPHLGLVDRHVVVDDLLDHVRGGGAAAPHPTNGSWPDRKPRRAPSDLQCDGPP